MKRRTFLKQGALFSVGSALCPGRRLRYNSELSMYKAASTLHSASNEEKAIRVLHLNGTPRERGRIHGETLRHQIKKLVSIWKDELHHQTSINPDIYLMELLERTNFTKAIKLWTPDLMEEVEGIAEGAEIDSKTMLAYQLVDEEWWYSAYGYRTKSIPVTTYSKHCSALAVFGQKDLPTYVAQNLDIPAFTDGFQTLLHIKYEDSPLECLVFTYAGLISACGMNNHGIGQVVNALLQLDHRADGLPVAFVNRGILERTTHDAAVKFLHDIRHASGQNYIIGGRRKASAHECSANKVSRFEPYEGAIRLYHTNHPLANDDQDIYKEWLESVKDRWQPKHPNNSDIRFMSLEKRLKNPMMPITIDSIKEMLSSKDDLQNPVCNEKRADSGGVFTAGCLIMDLSEKPVLHLAPGPPCTTNFRTYSF
jgi:isopenicillin-N N-acyltransferase-like protein